MQASMPIFWPRSKRNCKNLMAEIVTVARPYAEGLFRLAKESNAFAKWSDVLSVLAAVVGHDEVKEVVTNPKFSAGQVQSLLSDVLGDKADDQVKNLVKTLQENGRLTLLPEIAIQFEQLKSALNSTVDAHIVSAFPLDGAQLQALVAKLEARFKQKVDAQISVDPELLGGVRIEIGDEVIDASVRGKLQAMAFRLKS
ncbi:F-type H+-transporting ATPase subunit delta [Chitinivorax tropicus]|uniref:ATP synthase subunit delta n=1 Tax=Chitinivorax tropicus TaxID=714531 RepID=A0A840MHD6_9PROT|nr:F0F1 ATP synthase subunit delta [Chitinivorax tropicus]MBB5018068.1 F-type H+-transporting ATPase subunit delta [Chitinivorax tropicus]